MNVIKKSSIKKINIAQIGVGYWGPNLLRNLSVNKYCEVKTIVDLSKERREFVINNYPNIVTTNNVNVVLNDNTINAVVIATPVSTHFDLAIKCLKAGKHVLIEKPMATTVDQIEEINIIAKKYNLIAMVGHTFLYNSAVRYVKKYINNGDLGDIRYIYSQRLNLGRIRSDVDALWNLAPHDISIIQYWLDDPEPMSVERSGQSYVQKGVDDVVFLNMSYKGGVMANIHVSWLDPNKVRKITVVGSKKMIVYDDIAENKIAIYDKGIDPLAKIGDMMDFDDMSIQNYKHRSGDVILPKLDWKEPLQTEIKHFIDCIITGRECITNPTHARRVVSILERIS